MDGFFRWFLKLEWNIKGKRVSFLDALLVLAITASAGVMHLVLMGGAYSVFPVFNFTAALLGGCFIYLATGDVVRTAVGYSVLNLVPTAMVVSSYWQKPEMLYVAVVLLALVLFGAKKDVAASVVYAIGVLMNRQAVFVLPAILFYLWMKEADMKKVKYPMIISTLASALAVVTKTDLQTSIFGYGNANAAERVLSGIKNGMESYRLSLGDGLKYESAKAVYEGTMELAGKDASKFLSHHYFNVYQFFGVEEFTTEYAVAGIGLLAAILLSLAVIVYIKRPQIKEGIHRMAFFTELCLGSVLLATFFLPHMNARSGLLADVLAVILAVLCVKKAPVALVQLILSFCSYQICLTGICRYPEAAGSVAAMVLLGIVAVDVCKSLEFSESVVPENERTIFGIPYIWFTYLVWMLIIGIVIRIAFLPYISQDYTGYWELWFAQIHKYGGMKSLAYNFYDYSPLFMYFLVFIEGLPFDPMFTYKIAMSVVDLLLAGALGLVTAEVTGSKNKGYLASGIAFLIPTVMVNSALWCQCDVIYTTFILLTLYFFMKEKPTPAMIFYGLAFCLKLQSMFIFPALFIFWVKKKVRCEQIFWLPGLYVLSIIPAWIAGRPFRDLLLVYFAQGYTDTWALTLSWPNIYEIITPQAMLQVYSTLGKCLIITILMCTMYYMGRKEYNLTREIMLEMVVFNAILTVFFLPFMHERYGYVADVLLVAYALKNPRRWYLPVVHVLISMVSYTTFLSHLKPLPMIFYAFLLTGILCVVGADLFKSMHREAIAENTQ